MGRSLHDRWQTSGEDCEWLRYNGDHGPTEEHGDGSFAIKVRARWLLRYVNGDVLAIADFFAIRRSNWDAGRSPGARIEAPTEFRYMLRDDSADVIVMDYDFERISDFDYDNYKALGFPKAVYSQHHGLLVLERTDDDVS